jgi:hypothetical protein
MTKGGRSPLPRTRRSKMIRIEAILSLTVFLATTVAPGALAQQINGTPGSPSATTTIDGNQLPPLPPNFGGVIKEDATFDIGSDTRTTVDDSYKLPFRFTGKIDKLTYKLGPEQMTNDEQKRIRHAMERARD